jgi:hypothetical protein
MTASKWAILGALAGLAGIAINKQLRLARHRLAEALPDAEGRSSIDDVPTLQPQAGAEASGAAMPAGAATDDTMRYDDTVAPGAPL